MAGPFRGQDARGHSVQAHSVQGKTGYDATAGRLDFGPWEQIFYGEFDGRRPKRVLVKVIGE